MFSKTKTKDVYDKFDGQKFENEFCSLLKLRDLDQRIAEQPSLIKSFEDDLEVILSDTFAEGESAHDSHAISHNTHGRWLDRESNDWMSDPVRTFTPNRHLFLHRILYRINRLKLFWYDDLDDYSNEDSAYLFKVRKRIESVWQAWESENQDCASLELSNVVEGLKDRVAKDLEPQASPENFYFRDEMTESGYRRLLAIASLDGLVEASQLSRVLGGAANEIQSMVTRIFLEEYGGGQLRRKHSTFFTSMLNEFGMNLKPEAYFNLVPWEVLANINHSFFLCDRKRHFLRYIGGLLYTEVSVPSSFVNFRQAGERLGLSRSAIEYWDLHIKEDKKHGQWMLDDVALPLVERYKENAWEILLGYDQQRVFSARAGQAVAKSVKEADMDCSLESLLTDYQYPTSKLGNDCQ